MTRTQKIILIIFAIVFAAWIVVLIGNVVTSGWEIIGINDIWPMLLCAVMMIVFMRTKLNPPSKGNGVLDEDAGINEEPAIDEMLDENTATDEAPDANVDDDAMPASDPDESE